MGWVRVSNRGGRSGGWPAAAALLAAALLLVPVRAAWGSPLAGGSRGPEPPVPAPAPLPPTPAVSSVTPGAGAEAGGTAVTIRGSGFTSALGVAFGGRAATDVQVVSGGEITAVAPPGRGVQNVFVIGPGGVSAPSAAGLFRYGLAQPSSAGSGSPLGAPGVFSGAAATVQFSVWTPAGRVRGRRAPGAP